MSDFEELQAMIVNGLDSMSLYAGTVNRYAETCQREVERLWADNAELRDEINAVANRVESLTRAVMADPAEVAAAIVNDANRSTLRVACVDYDPVTGETTVRRRGPE